MIWLKGQGLGLGSGAQGSLGKEYMKGDKSCCKKGMTSHSDLSPRSLLNQSFTWGSWGQGEGGHQCDILRTPEKTFINEGGNHYHSSWQTGSTEPTIMARGGTGTLGRPHL